MKKIGVLFLGLIVLGSLPLWAHHPSVYKLVGMVKDSEGVPLMGATVSIEKGLFGTTTNEEGKYVLNLKEPREYKVTASYLGYRSEEKIIHIQDKKTKLNFILEEEVTTLNDIEVFGVREKQPEKLNFLTRMPLRPSEQIQSISVLSNRLIEEQGALSITDAVKNVVGVSQFANYGGVQESLSARGYRGLPVLKNGVRVQSDFRGTGFITEMQGIESIQILKGSAAITQGIGNDLGSAGGVVNLATKTPKFIDQSVVALRGGSWGLFRPTFDVQTVVGQKLGIRINGAYERADNFRKHVQKDRIYINPSVAWRVNDKLTLIAEMDYLHDARTPDKGTVNLSADSVYDLYKMPHNKFLGFKTDKNIFDNLTYSLRGNYQLSDNYFIRLAFAGSSLETDNTSTSTKALNEGDNGYNIRQRSIGRSQREDKNQVLQLDFIGKDVKTGPLKHTFQVGMDYRTNRLSTTAFTPLVIDTIDVLKEISNELPSTIKTAKKKEPLLSKEYSYGFMVQDVISLTSFLKGVLGLRYSSSTSSSENSIGAVTGDAWNPMAGIMISPIKELNFFGSYTTTTSLRSAASKLENNEPIGASRSDQFEVGVKSDWLENRLRFNLTYFHILNKNLAYSIYGADDQPTGYYGKAGNLRRQGIETEVTGRVLPNLELIVGYSFLDAQYEDSPAYYEGSSPMNAPRHTGNAWVYYTLNRGLFNGLSLGVGSYYVGARPVNEHTIKVTHAGMKPEVKPFDMPSYTTVNAQIAYSYNRIKLQLFFNNIFDATGYTSYYRGGFINQIDPFNVSASLNYRF